MKEIILDNQTSFICGYDEYKVNEGIPPRDILASGILTESDEHEPIIWLVVNTVNEPRRFDYERSLVAEIQRMGEESLSPDEFGKLESALHWIKEARKL